MKNVCLQKTVQPLRKPLALFGSIQAENSITRQHSIKINVLINNCCLLPLHSSPIAAKSSRFVTASIID